MSILFISPSPKEPSGGVKVIYQFCETLLKQGYQSEIVHTDNLMGYCDWLSYDVIFRRNLFVDSRVDFVVIPEGAAGFIGKTCIELGIKFCILVQNGYQTFNVHEQSTRVELDEVYHKASYILSISEDTTSSIIFNNKNIDINKILRVYPRINSNIFYREGCNTKKIVFMPRRLGTHCRILSYFLENHIPSHWVINSIHEKSEVEVGELLRNSSIFLSFSDLEGFGLPPLEAAISGNIIVGYSGSGGDEYFHGPIFRKVEYGNFIYFTKKIIEAINDIENGFLNTRKYLDELFNLNLKYSDEIYTHALVDFANKVNHMLVNNLTNHINLSELPPI